MGYFRFRRLLDDPIQRVQWRSELDIADVAPTIDGVDDAFVGTWQQADPTDGLSCRLVVLAMRIAGTVVEIHPGPFGRSVEGHRVGRRVGLQLDDKLAKRKEIWRAVVVAHLKLDRHSAVDKSVQL